MRRTTLSWILVSLLLTLAPHAIAAPFVFVSLPDTQVYAEDRLPEPGRTPAVTDPRGTGAIFFDQTQWIVDNAAALDIRYVGHLGDIVQNGNAIDEWELADDAMHLLRDADVPHGTVMGNHDDTSHPPTYQSNYLEYFGPQHYADRPWYTASSPGGGANLQMLEHGPYKIGFLNFSIDHPRSEVEWATDIVEANRDTIFVIGTHRYLYDFRLGGGRYEEEVETEVGITIELPQGTVPGVTDGLSAEELFQEFVSQQPNVLMIHAGHFHSEWLRLDEQNVAGNTIIQILTDYQSTRNGGDGYLRLYELDFDANQLRFHTYSPTLDRRRTVIDHFVESIYLVWDQRHQVMDLLGLADDEIYLALMQLLLKQSASIPDDFLDAHPDYDEPHERAYYEQYMSDLFHGDVPPEFRDITEWEQMWYFGFAANRDDLSDYGDGPRSPSGVVDVDFLQYFTPSPEQLVSFAFEDLRQAVESLAPGDLIFSFARQALLYAIDRAWLRAELGHTRAARQILEATVGNRTDGCSLRGERDRLFGFYWSIRQWIWAWLNFDLVTTCPGQAQVQEPLQEVLELLD